MLLLNRIYHLGALAGLQQLPSASVDVIITSPPYWRLRDYGVENQIGSEADFNDYLDRLWAIFDEAKRVLKKDGTCWVNLGDMYGGSGLGASKSGIRKGKNSILPDDLSYLPTVQHNRGKLDKCLMCIPERFALGMIQRGWTLRNKIIWYKPNHMPHSVKDRLANSWEYLFLFTKSRKYYFDLDAIRLPYKASSYRRAQSFSSSHKTQTGQYAISNKNINRFIKSFLTAKLKAKIPATSCSLT